MPRHPLRTLADIGDAVNGLRGLLYAKRQFDETVKGITDVSGAVVDKVKNTYARIAGPTTTPTSMASRITRRTTRRPYRRYTRRRTFTKRRPYKRTYKRRFVTRRRKNYVAKSFIKQKSIWFKTVGRQNFHYTLTKAAHTTPMFSGEQVVWLPIDDQYPVKSAIFDNYQEKKLDEVVVRYTNFRVFRKLHFKTTSNDAIDQIQDRKQNKIYWYHKREAGESYPQDPSTGDEEPYNSFITRSPKSGFTMRYRPDCRTYTGDTLSQLATLWNKTHGMAEYLVEHDDKKASSGTTDQGYTFDVKYGLDINIPSEFYENDEDKVSVSIYCDIITYTKFKLRRPRPYGRVTVENPVSNITEEDIDDDMPNDTDDDMPNDIDIIPETITNNNEV